MGYPWSYLTFSWHAVFPLQSPVGIVILATGVEITGLPVRVTSPSLWLIRLLLLTWWQRLHRHLEAHIFPWCPPSG